MLSKWRYVGVIQVAFPKYSRGEKIEFKMNQTFYFLCLAFCPVLLQCCFEMVNDTWNKHSRLNLFRYVHEGSALLPHCFHQQRPCYMRNTDNILLVLFCGHCVRR